MDEGHLALRYPDNITRLEKIIAGNRLAIDE